MHIESTLICRASGKIYELLLIEDVASESHVSPIFRPQAGRPPLPCRLYELCRDSGGIRSVVAVYPDAPVPTSHYVVGEFSNDGTLLAEWEIGVDFKRAKWMSRANYRLRAERCAEIRCIDERTPETYETRFESLVAVSTATHLILKCRATLPDSSHRGDLSIAAINEGMDVIASNYTILSETTSPSPVEGGPCPFRLAFSMKIPWNQNIVYFVIYSTATGEFLHLERQTKETRDELQAHMDRLLYHNAEFDPYYPEWLRLHRATERELKLQKQHPIPSGPSFSIIVPLYKTPIELFREMAHSVIEQSYENWQLILVNASPEIVELANEVIKLESIDSRVKSVTLERNRGISENTNEGIALAKGDYISFLDHDDCLEPNALYEYARAIADDPSIDLLYCDEDKIAPDGTPTQPLFKPDFSIDMLRNVNYVCHMLTIRRALLEQLEPNTTDFDGAQDHNLTLEAAEKTGHIHHIPKVLYHWRITETSTAAGAESKPYAVQAGLRAVKRHLERMGIAATVSVDDRGTLRVIYDVPEETPLVSIIIPTKNNAEILRRCISSILEKSTYSNYEVLIIDNGSTEPDVEEFYSELDDKRLSVMHYDIPFNFSAIINEGTRNTRGDYLILLNNDTEVITPNWIELMLGMCARKDVGAVGVKLLYPDNTIQHAGVNITGGPVHFFTHLPNGAHSYFDFADKPRNLSAVTGACMMTKRSAFNEVGGFNEDLAVAFNDVDYCLKLRAAGHLVVYNPLVELYHYESISRGFDEDRMNLTRALREKAILLTRWPEHYICDPYYTPNLRQGLPDSAYYMS